MILDIDRSTPVPGRSATESDMALVQDLRVARSASGVPVVVKKRRTLVPSSMAASEGSAGAGPMAGAPVKQSRVFTVTVEARDDPPAAVLHGPEASLESAPPRRRRRRAPNQAPGEVTRIVFAPPPAALAAEPVVEATPAAVPTYEDIQAGLATVRDTLRLAQAARHLRFL